MINITKLVQEINPRAIEIWQSIHENPELSMQEYKTKNFLLKIIEQEVEYDNLQHVGDTGLLVELIGTKDKTINWTIGLRGDMDALPITEKTELPYASKTEGVMHACGHDVHTTFLLGTLLVLSKIKHEFSGKVKFFFQPAEENLMGAKLFLNDPDVDMDELDGIVGLHIIPELYAGQITTKKGPVLASADKLTIRVHGKGCHAAHPELGIDPIIIVGNIINSIQTIISRYISPIENGLVSICQIHGGEAHNIIPEVIEMVGTIRATSPSTQKIIHDLLYSMCENIASTYGGRVEVVIEEGVPSLSCDQEWVDRTFRVGTKLLGKENVIKQEHPFMGGEDFAFLKGSIPGVFVRVGARTPGKEFGPTHSPFYYTDKNAISVGIKMMLGIAMDFLGEDYR